MSRTQRDELVVGGLLILVLIIVQVLCVGCESIGRGFAEGMRRLPPGTYSITIAGVTTTIDVSRKGGLVPEDAEVVPLDDDDAQEEEEEDDGAPDPRDD